MCVCVCEVRFQGLIIINQGMLWWTERGQELIFFLWYCRVSDINECVENPGICQQNCSNNDGSYECSCSANFVLGMDGVTCTRKLRS